jgi:hypothetical protein
VPLAEETAVLAIFFFLPLRLQKYTFFKTSNYARGGKGETFLEMENCHFQFEIYMIFKIAWGSTFQMRL